MPAEGAYEIRVKGPIVTPGYFARPDLTAAAFDEQGFYRTGDGVDLADPGDPALCAASASQHRPRRKEGVMRYEN